MKYSKNEPYKEHLAHQFAGSIVWRVHAERSRERHNVNFM